jgi:hypothetical protein
MCGTYGGDGPSWNSDGDLPSLRKVSAGGEIVGMILLFTSEAWHPSLTPSFHPHLRNWTGFFTEFSELPKDPTDVLGADHPNTHRQACAPSALPALPLLYHLFTVEFPEPNNTPIAAPVTPLRVPSPPSAKLSVNGPVYLYDVTFTVTSTTTLFEGSDRIHGGRTVPVQYSYLFIEPLGGH